LEDIIKERRLRLAGHIMRMESRKIARQATNWKQIDGRGRTGRPHSDWQQTVKVDVRGGINWEQIPDLAVDRGGPGDREAWRKLTALCAISTGGTSLYKV